MTFMPIMSCHKLLTRTKSANSGTNCNLNRTDLVLNASHIFALSGWTAGRQDESWNTCNISLLLQSMMQASLHQSWLLEAT